MKIRTALVLTTILAVLVTFGLTEHFRHNALDAQLAAQHDSTQQFRAQRAEALKAVDSLRGVLIVAHAVTQEAQARADSAVARSDSMRGVVRTVDSTHVLIADVVHQVPAAVTLRFAADSTSIAALDSVLSAKSYELDVSVTENTHLLSTIVVDSLVMTSLENENATLRRMKRPRFGFKSGLVAGVSLTIAAVKIVRAVVKKPP